MEAMEAKARDSEEKNGKIAGTVSKLMAKTYIPLVVAICSRCLAKKLKESLDPPQHTRPPPKVPPSSKSHNPHIKLKKSIRECINKFAEIHFQRLAARVVSLRGRQVTLR